MATVTAKTSYHHGDLRQQLITATRVLVEEKGPDNFSVSEACRAAGVSTAAPYKHFADRTAMLRAVCLEGFAEMTARFHKAAEGQPLGAIETIAALGIQYVFFAEENPGLFRMMFAASEDTEETHEAGHACYGALLSQIAANLGRDTVDQDVIEAAFPLWTYVHGLAFLRIDGKVDFARVGRPVEDLVLDASQRLLDARPA